MHFFCFLILIGSMLSALTATKNAHAELQGSQLESCAQRAILNVIDGQNWLITKEGFQVQTAPTAWDLYRAGVVRGIEKLSLTEDQLTDFNIHLVTFRIVHARAPQDLVLQGSIRMITERVLYRKIEENPDALFPLPNYSLNQQKVGNNSSVEMVDQISGKAYRCTLVSTVQMPNRAQNDIQGFEFDLRVIGPKNKASR